MVWAGRSSNNTLPGVPHAATRPMLLTLALTALMVIDMRVLGLALIAVGIGLVRGR